MSGLFFLFSRSICFADDFPGCKHACCERSLFVAHLFYNSLKACERFPAPDRWHSDSLKPTRAPSQSDTSPKPLTYRCAAAAGAWRIKTWNVGSLASTTHLLRVPNAELQSPLFPQLSRLFEAGAARL